MTATPLPPVSPAPADPGLILAQESTSLDRARWLRLCAIQSVGDNPTIAVHMTVFEREPHTPVATVVATVTIYPNKLSDLARLFTKMASRLGLRR